MNLNDLFAIAFRRAPDKVALQFQDENVSLAYRYRELQAAVEGLAAGLGSWGLRKGDRVAFFLGNRPEFVIAYLAVIRLGAVLVPVNLRYRRHELSHILADCRPRLLITERGQLPFLTDLPEEMSCVEATIVVDEPESWEGFVQAGGEAAPAPVAGDDLAMIMYTSGTTGPSKGAKLSHNNVLATVTGLLAAWGWQPDDVLLLCLPLFHVHGLTVGLHCALAAGATVLLRPRFNAEQTVHELLGGEPTLFFGVPTLYVRLVEALRRCPQPLALDHMRLFCSGSAPLAVETFNAFQELTRFAILERYGMTETGMNLSNLVAGPRIPGTVGVPLPGVSMRIVDDQQRDVAPGAEGELLVRGSHVFIGYWQAPEKTEASFSTDEMGNRWFHTGDLARQDPATGYVTLLGRRHELIISGGFNIYPREIEELILAFPGVVEAAVVGLTHAEWGEVPIACLVVNETFDEAGLVSYCRRQLAGFKIPREFRYLEALPRNAMGKVQKHQLRSQ